MLSLGEFLNGAESSARWDTIEWFMENNPSTGIEEVLVAIERTGIQILDEVQIDIEAGEFGIDDPVGVYWKEMCGVPLLSTEREEELTKLMPSGDKRISESARKDLVEPNLRIPVALARHFPRAGKHILDLIIEGNEGLLEAAQSFDPEAGYR